MHARFAISKRSISKPRIMARPGFDMAYTSRAEATKAQEPSVMKRSALARPLHERADVLRSRASRRPPWEPSTSRPALTDRAAPLSQLRSRLPQMPPLRIAPRIATLGAGPHSDLPQALAPTRAPPDSLGPSRQCAPTSAAHSGLHLAARPKAISVAQLAACRKPGLVSLTA